MGVIGRRAQALFLARSSPFWNHKMVDWGLRVSGFICALYPNRKTSGAFRILSPGWPFPFPFPVRRDSSGVRLSDPMITDFGPPCNDFEWRESLLVGSDTPTTEHRLAVSVGSLREYQDARR
jgi:hypothetical protein